MAPLDPDSILQRAVGSLAVWVEPMYSEDSLRAVSREITELAVHAVPIMHDNVMVGAVSEREIAQALSQGYSPDDPVTSFMNSSPATLSPAMTGSEALEIFQSTGTSYLIVLDSQGIPVGVLAPSLLIEAHGSRQHLGRVGGMATPFGVYLTNGVVSGGAGKWALFATGMLMFSVFALVGTILLAVVNNVPLVVQRQTWFPGALQVAWTLLFFGGIRLMPLAGTHAAEHMVVHAIERGEDLKPEIVSRMPRVHPRCGTNLATAAMLFLGIMSLDIIPQQELRLLLAALVTVCIWQPLGSMIQYFATTKPPTAAQIESGIASGKQLLERMSKAPVSRPTVLGKLIASGLFQVFLGAVVVELLLYGIYQVLRIPDAWRVT